MEVKAGFEIKCITNNWLKTLLPGFKFDKTPVKGQIYIIEGFQHPRFVYLKGMNQLYKGQRIGWDLIGFEPMPFGGNAIPELLKTVDQIIPIKRNKLIFQWTPKGNINSEWLKEKYRLYNEN